MRARETSAAAARSISSSVVNRPTLSLTAPRPNSGGTPIAWSTGDRQTLPSWQADPVEAAKCDRFGTQIDFVRSPAIAFDRAGREGKLAMVLHLAGHFEDPGFT